MSYDAREAREAGRPPAKHGGLRVGQGRRTGRKA